MINQTAPASADGAAQPIADANPINRIVDDATLEQSQEETETDSTEPAEPVDDVKDEPFPKKAINALSRRDKKIGKLEAERNHLAAELEKFRQTQQPIQQNKPSNSGEPQEKDFNNYHEYIRAVNKYDAEQLLAARDSKTQETQQSMQEQVWVTQRQQAVAVSAQAFAKENPEVVDLVEEYGDVIDGWEKSHPHLTRTFLEADNAPLAFYNLAKEGKLEELSNMSPARAAMEIGRAQTQAIVKPKTKAPTPLPASRGSVPSGRSVDDMDGKEIRAWLRAD